MTPDMLGASDAMLHLLNAVRGSYLGLRIEGFNPGRCLGRKKGSYMVGVTLHIAKQVYNMNMTSVHELF